MNIFYLDRDPKVAAEMHCDKHVIKMILESAQMLSSAHRFLDGDQYADKVALYKMSHKNHPSNLWVRSSDDHYKWLFNLMLSQMEEYTYRYDKHHATERLIEPLRLLPLLIKENGFVDPPMCMPEYCKSNDTVLSYQNYYITEKSDFATWKRRARPKWFSPIKGGLNEYHTGLCL